MNDLTKLTASVDRAIAEIEDLKTKLNSSDDQAALDALTAKLDTVVPDPAAPVAAPTDTSSFAPAS